MKTKFALVGFTARGHNTGYIAPHKARKSFNTIGTLLTLLTYHLITHYSDCYSYCLGIINNRLPQEHI